VLDRSIAKVNRPIYFAHQHVIWRRDGGRSAKSMTGFTISSAWRTLDTTPVDWAQAEELAG
jgi:hypothetical protein